MKVYFFCYPLGPPEQAGYEHHAIGLSEGLNELGVQLLCNTNLWQNSLSEKDFVIRRTDVADAFKECDIVVFTSFFYLYNRLDLLPADLFDKKRKYQLIFLDCADGLITPGFNKEVYLNVDLILKSHFNKRHKYPQNFRPWQFGFTNRVLEAINPIPFHERKKDILINFRLSHKLRDFAKTEILPFTFNKFKPNDSADRYEDLESSSKINELFWRQSGRRHYPAYFKRLSESMACACFGGFLQGNMDVDTFTFKHKVLYQVNKFYPVIKHDRVYQFDSYRFWEALVAGTCVFHVDLKKLGAEFPTSPLNGKHYIGIDVNQPHATKKIMNRGYNYFEDIAEHGREWAITHYSPVTVANRFLQMCKQ